MPLFMTRQALDDVKKGEIVEILADDPASKKDITEWAERMGHEVVSVEEVDGVFRFLIKKGR